MKVTGWMALPDEALDEVEVHLDNRHLFTQALAMRDDVKAAFPWLIHCGTGGFVVELPPGGVLEGRTSRLDLIARSTGQRRGKLSQFVRSDIEQFPSPPGDFSFRVSHAQSPHFFKVGGLKTVGDFLEPLARHADVGKIRRVLDWGCGCGRVAMYLMAAENAPEILGCDIDFQTVAWCNENLKRGAFAVLQPMPPAPYPDGHFDFIYSYSVFTHLTRDVQHAWLAEMRRLLTPGGIFLATTHGQFALQFAHASLTAAFPPEGIYDSHLDPTLDAIAPKDYYRATYQSKEYTLREFGKHFEILEYIERGATNFQDVVVMRKR